MSANSGALAHAAWKPKANPWLIAFVVSLAAFMEVLDTSIANVALPHIAGNLGASSDESTWVLTSYLVSNAIVLPITGWLVSLMGRKRFFLICISLFTVSSLFCGIAPSLAILLLSRVIQGAGGGGLQPMAQAILADTFPPEKRGLAFSVYGVTAVVAPSIGPTLGGWITDNYTWRWIFLMNLPVGLLALFLVIKYVEDPPFLRRLTLKESKVDYVGFGFLAIGIAFLQIVLDKGQEDDWFGSHFIVTLSVISVVCLVFLVIWELRVKEPILDIRLFRNLNFATASVMMFMVGAASFSTTVLMPQFLQSLHGIYGPKRRHGALRRRDHSADRAPAGGAIDRQNPGALFNGLRVGDAHHCDVLLHAPYRSPDQLRFGDLAADCAVRADRIYLHSGNHGGVSRDCLRKRVMLWPV